MGLRDDLRSLFQGGQKVKQSFLVVNSIVLICSLILIIVGAINISPERNGLETVTLPAGVVAVGTLTLVISLVGCIGAIRNQRACLIAFFVIVLIFAIIELGIGGAAYVQQRELPMIVNNAWSAMYNMNSSFLYTLENEFQCCGFNATNDRAVPPFTTDATCLSLSPGFGGCSDGIYNYLYFVGQDTTNEWGRAQLRSFQTSYQCCGYFTSSDSLFVPFYTENSTTCAQNLGTGLPTCQLAIETAWVTAHYYKDDDFIYGMQNKYRCCGWANGGDLALPPFSNNTCTAIKGYTTSCQSAMETAFSKSLAAIGAACVAIGIIEFFSLVLSGWLIRISRLQPGQSRAQELALTANHQEKLEDEE